MDSPVGWSIPLRESFMHRLQSEATDVGIRHSRIKAASCHQCCSTHVEIIDHADVRVYPTSTMTLGQCWPNVAINVGTMLTNNVGPMLCLHLDFTLSQHCLHMFAQYWFNIISTWKLNSDMPTHCSNVGAMLQINML